MGQNKIKLGLNVIQNPSDSAEKNSAMFATFTPKMFTALATLLQAQTSTHFL